MDGRLVPQGYARLEPFERNLTENIAAVQFDHRLLATLTVVASIVTLVVGFAMRSPRASRFALLAFLGAALVQYGLGVATLLLVVPIALATLHQAVRHAGPHRRDRAVAHQPPASGQSAAMTATIFRPDDDPWRLLSCATPASASRRRTSSASSSRSPSSTAALARRFQGAGLGLYVSRALVAGHGGELSLRSVPGAGTTAEIRLPAERLIAAGQ